MISKSKQNRDQDQDQKDKRRLQNLRSKRKKNLIKKAHELAMLGNMKVTVVIYDPKWNIMQEFNSSEDHTLNDIIEHITKNNHLKLD